MRVTAVPTRLALAGEGEAEILAIALDQAAGRVREMRREDQPARVGLLVEKADAGLAGLCRIGAKPGAPLRIPDLQRVMHQVGTEDGLAATTAKPDHELSGGVAGR